MPCRDIYCILPPNNIAFYYGNLWAINSCGIIVIITLPFEVAFTKGFPLCHCAMPLDSFLLANVTLNLYSLLFYWHFLVFEVELLLQF